MNLDDIIGMAREAGDCFRDSRGREEFIFDCYGIERFANLVAAAEREACAKVCEEIVIEGWRDAGWDMGTIDCAAAIRARGQG
jgi:hypothetical protein